ncbi:hypothetical protein Tco_0375001 [Tanacetum coccineum]
MKYSELRDQAYAKSFIYKEEDEEDHDSKDKKQNFNVGRSSPSFQLPIKDFLRKAQVPMIDALQGSREALVGRRGRCVLKESDTTSYPIGWGVKSLALNDDGGSA